MALTELREAVLTWERDRPSGRPVVLRGRLERDGLSIDYDDRLDRLETEFPSQDELLETLPASMADAVQAAAAAAIDQGLVAAPLLLEVFAAFPPSARLVGDASRRRRQSLPAQEPELFFPEGVELAVDDHASPEALRQCRQIRQLSRLTPTSRDSGDHEGRRQRRTLEIEQENERHERYRRALQDELAARALPGATEDFVAIVLFNYVKREAALVSRLGQGGAAAFCATLRPAQPIKLPRGPGQLRDLDDVRLLLRSRGVRDDLVESITERAQWAIRLVPSEGRTRLGGLPALGSTAWPTVDGVALHFVAQVELTELPSVPSRNRLPVDGRLLFFYALGPEQPVEESEAGLEDPARVLYLPADTTATPVHAPDGLSSFRSEALRASPRLTLPHPSTLNDLGLDWYDQVAYERALDRAAAINDQPRTGRSRHQILGQPTFIQDDPRIYPESPITDWKLLLSIHDRSEIGLTIADAGALYYFISDEALKEATGPQLTSYNRATNVAEGTTTGRSAAASRGDRKRRAFQSRPGGARHRAQRERPSRLQRVDCSYESVARSGGDVSVGTAGTVPCSG